MKKYLRMIDKKNYSKVFALILTMVLLLTMLPGGLFSMKISAAADEISLLDLNWVSATGFLDDDERTLPYKNMDWDGNPLEVDGIAYVGLGVHPVNDSETNGNIVYNIDGLGYNWFTAQISKTNSADTKIRFTVLVDGARMFDEVIGGLWQIEDVEVSVAGAKTLTLRINCTEDGYYNDGCEWLNPMISKEKPAVNTDPTTPQEYPDELSLIDLRLESTTGLFLGPNRNRDCDGNALIINGVTYKSGLGVHPVDDQSINGDIVYKIEGLGYELFSTLVAKTKPDVASRVYFAVLVDNVVKFETVLSDEWPLEAVEISVVGAKTLNLRINCSDDNYYDDGCAWLDPMLTKEPVEEPDEPEEPEEPEEPPVEWVVPEGLSEWAIEAVKSAVERGLTTDDLMENFQANTTRIEFCRAAVNFVEKYYDLPVADILEERGLDAKTFADTDDLSIAAAAALGITNGTDIERNLFSPELPLTREQAAAMLKRILDVLGVTVDSESVAWTDADSISGWAVEAIDIIYAAEVMGGTSTTSLVFSPESPYTHEQSVATFNRLWDYLITVSDDSQPDNFFDSPQEQATEESVEIVYPEMKRIVLTDIENRTFQVTFNKKVKFENSDRIFVTGDAPWGTWQANFVDGSIEAINPDGEGYATDYKLTFSEPYTLGDDPAPDVVPFTGILRFCVAQPDRDIPFIYDQDGTHLQAMYDSGTDYQAHLEYMLDPNAVSIRTDDK